MNVEVCNSDDPNHHRMGKDLLYSCPSEPPFAQAGKPSSPTNISPPITISPPLKHSIHKLLGLLKWLFIFRPSKHTSLSIVNLNYYFIENPTIENNNLSYFNAMKILGPIVNFGTIQENNFYGKNEQQNNEKKCEEDVENVEHTEVVEVQTNPTKEDNQPRIIRFFAQRSKAQPILSWLHETTDDLETPKERLLNVRAVYEAGHCTQRFPYKAYVEEFGPITKSRYNHWMGEELNYGRKDIDDIIEQFPF